MRMRRADDDAVQRIGRREIGDVTPASAHEARVFEAVEAAAEKRLCHVSCMERARCKGNGCAKTSARRKSAGLAPRLFQLFRWPHLVGHDILDVLRLDWLAALVDQHHPQLLAVRPRAQTEKQLAL